MSDVIVLPPSGAPLLCQCVTQGAQKEKKIMKKKLCASVLFKKKTIKSKCFKLTSCSLMSHSQEYTKKNKSNRIFEMFLIYISKKV